MKSLTQKGRLRIRQSERKVILLAGDLVFSTSPFCLRYSFGRKKMVEFFMGIPGTAISLLVLFSSFDLDISSYWTL